MRDEVPAFFHLAFRRRQPDLPDGAPIAVAVSGGPDSMALLHLAAEHGRLTGREVTALTVDHGIRPEAAQEALQVAEDSRISQGSLEQSNLNPVRAIVDLIGLTRYYQAMSKVTQTGSQMDQRRADQIIRSS